MVVATRSVGGVHTKGMRLRSEHNIYGCTYIICVINPADVNSGVSARRA